MVERPGRTAGDAGFTLIEPLAAVAIIGILTAFTIPRVVSAMSSSTAQSAIDVVRGTAAAFESYDDQNGCFPGGGGACGTVSTYADLDAALTPYGSTLPSDSAAASFWIVQGQPNSDAEAVDDSVSASGYTPVLYARNGEPSPSALNVTAGSGGTLLAGSAAAGATLSPAAAILPACKGGVTCPFSDRTAIRW